MVVAWNLFLLIVGALMFFDSASNGREAAKDGNLACVVWSLVFLIVGVSDFWDGFNYFFGG